MAISFSCDGCGSPVEKPEQRGLVSIKHYCSACVVIVDIYLKAIDDTHTVLAEEFRKRVTKLREDYHAAVPGALPDEP